MYEFVDRPVAGLLFSQRDVLLRMRRWVHAAMLVGGSADAVPAPFDHAMRLIDTHCASDLEIARPCALLIGESEAVLLSLWRLVGQRRRAPALALAAMLVGEAVGADLLTAIGNG